MAKITFRGLDEYTRTLVELNEYTNVKRICGRAVYVGAKIIADDIDRRIDWLQAITKKQRTGLHEGLGIARHKNEDGYINTAIGFAGYNEEGIIRGRKWPRGQPNILVARDLVRGRSYIGRQDFARASVRSKRHEVEEAMQKVVDEEIKKIMS